MECRLFLVALLALAGGQVTEGARHARTTTTTTTTPQGEDEVEISLFIPLSDSYNMTTQWLGLLRNSYIHIIRFETSERLQKSRQVADNVQLMADSLKRELDDLGVKAVEKDRPCVDKHSELGLQAFQTIDDELKSCARPLVDSIEKHDDQLDKVLKKVAAQDEAQIYSKCLPVETKLTRTILDRSAECFHEEYRLAVDSIYYPTGLELFSLVTEMTTTFLDLKSSATTCGMGVLDSHDKVFTKIFEDIRQCPTRVAMPGYAPYSRLRRGFGRKLKKGWKKLRKGVKKLCNRVPCRIGYSIPIPGK